MEHNIKIFSKRTVLYFAIVVLSGAECKNRLTDRLIADIDGDNATTIQQEQQQQGKDNQAQVIVDSVDNKTSEQNKSHTALETSGQKQESQSTQQLNS
ncbi:hypothetical protein [Cardinium endosymbiont of Oedothorax gibbosus]|uniref:hypothetical protein n=1 Tax=Cardinium endosymbiont of Oedothorax gibbosus TaxID=931101 RepID=UPI00202423F7|nr:hypothetical protein [Cardinium endosymbiont of Oedothorax gibbosus]CAH2559899.1 hypothetical protein CAOEGIBSW744_0449 [Cardinium endosymbiont of Oedothorax gibbosus]